MTEAKVLLLDEPFASLDAIPRRQLQLWLEGDRCQPGFEHILVTHDISEAIILSDRLVLMKGNRDALRRSLWCGQRT
jgi:sulfonate transport system ATP-binding protein